MKKVLATIVILGMVMGIFGCTGINANIPVNVATDTAFVLALQNNPTYKPAVIAGLQTTKAFLAGNVTYDDLILQISKQFGGKCAVIGIILSGYIATDTPISTSLIPMLDSYKAAVVAKIDRFITLANAI